MQIKDSYYKSTEKLLYNYNMLKVSIENMNAEIRELESESGVTSIDYESEKIAPTNKIGNPTEEVAIKNITSIDLLKKRIEKTQDKIDKMDRAIEKLSESEKQIITMRYIDGKQWFEIAYEANYNERWCKELRKRAIKKLTIGVYGYTALIEHQFIENI
ncbi:DNA-directed RNA polymerase specialized sigma subunit, sigma24 [Gottschalkia purinilytica]|uniref:DNA-directed RNA polymerase specialized sigma subunit, sigma24 n=1 Tax=Gottschalkia purinilytica TaxID=1503 RepID=A0A0L0W640_GOTPU|nr:sigma factor-like helix-turn-helix DNA-binding protein [Gottschalkia purinilytica]KNF06988.1 DNA-directed RNA polymerase specialized sigma subunit, sigma24 [Gottschalkia purinilytica]